MNVISETRLAQ